MERTMIADTIGKINSGVLVKGWINARRDHGKIVFIDVRDRTGIVQVVLSRDLAVNLRNESVVAIAGNVRERPENLVNPALLTGKIEINALSVDLISKAADLPIPIDTDGRDIDEEIKLKYRYLDLRRPRMANIIRTRSKVTLFIRNYLSNLGFVEIETPILTKTTPEGARDFLVPSRLQKGKFYALPQSPQQYKQMLMVAGFERYFQFARCFRDEDPRKDRAYGEFTQLDMELSFTSQAEILDLVENMFYKLIREFFPNKKVAAPPWPRLAHKMVMEKYGTDKPDLRHDKNDPDELAFSWTVDFPLFNKQTEEDFFYGSGKAKFAPSHHMFTAPHPDDIPLLDTDPMKVRGLQHDLVLNGFEVGGGSIRIHQPDVQNKVFDLIGFSSQQKAQFSHMLEAFTFGVPPHGGIAPGLDRLLMTIMGEPSVREVIAFPAISSGQTAVMSAPSEAAPAQLAELGISVIGHQADLSVFENIKMMLENSGVKYRLFEHEATLTSEQSAKVRGTQLSQGAKAMIMFADDKPVMLVLPANLKIDSKKFKTAFSLADLKMATPDQISELTNTEIGAVPPFGNLFNLPLYVDQKLSENDEIAFNAGLRTKSIKMKYKDFVKLAGPVVCSFSQGI